MKKTICVALTFCLILCFFSGCSVSQEKGDTANTDTTATVIEDPSCESEVDTESETAPDVSENTGDGTVDTSVESCVETTEEESAETDAESDTKPVETETRYNGIVKVDHD